MSPGLRRALLYAVLALCLCGFAYVQGRSDAVDQQALQRAETLLAGHTGYLRVIDSLRSAEARYVGLEGFWRAKADSLAHSALAAGVKDTLKPTQPSGAANTLVTVPSDSLRVIFLGRALDACDASRSAADSALALCRVRGDSLEAALRGVLAVRGCKILFFKCPSRSALFVLGAVGGALLEHRLSH